MDTKSTAISVVCGEIAPGVWLGMASTGGFVTRSQRRHTDAISAARSALEALLNDDLGLAIALEGGNVESLEAMAKGELPNGG